MIITVDRGVGDVRTYPPGSHPGIVVVLLRDLRPSVMLMLVVTFITEHTFEEFRSYNVVLEPGSIRVRRPPDAPTPQGQDRS